MEIQQIPINALSTKKRIPISKTSKQPEFAGITTKA